MNTTLRTRAEHRSITLGDLAALVAGVALVLVLPRRQSYWPYSVDFLGPWPRWLPWCFCLRQALGAACMVLVPVILRRRAIYGGLARPAEFLAVCAAMPFFADAIETALIRLRYRQQSGHSLPGFTLDGMPTAITTEWWERGHLVWERSLLLAGALALLAYFLARRKMPGWLLTAFVAVAWFGAYESGARLASGWAISSIARFRGQIMSETGQLLILAVVFLLPRFVLFSTPAIAAIRDVRRIRLCRPSWLEWTGLGLAATLFFIAEPTEAVRVYSTTPSKSEWAMETLVHAATMLAALLVGFFLNWIVVRGASRRMGDKVQAGK